MLSRCHAMEHYVTFPAAVPHTNTKQPQCILIVTPLAPSGLLILADITSVGEMIP